MDANKKPPGIARQILESKFSKLPPSDVKNGHILYQFLSHARDYAATARAVDSQNLCRPVIKSKIHHLVKRSLLKFKKLTNKSEEKKFLNLCNAQFVLPSVGSPEVKTDELTDQPTASTDFEETRPTASTIISEDVMVTRSRHSQRCERCPALKQKIRQLINEKKQERQKNFCRMKRLRKEVKPVKRLNALIKRRNNSLARNKERLREMKRETCVRENKALKKKLHRCKKTLKRLKTEKCKVTDALISKKVKKTVSQIESSYQNNLLQVQDELNSINQPSELSKEGKVFSNKIRRLVYESILANVPTGKIPELLQSFSRQLGVPLSSNDVPVRSTVEAMAVELGVISDLQAAEILYNSTNVTLAFDATTQEGVHINAVHITTEEKCIILSVEQLAGGTAKDYASHAIQSIEHITEVYSKFYDTNFKDTLRTMKRNITTTMSDRAAVNHAAVRLINENFETTLTEVNCHLHPLDTISSKCKSTLKKIENDNNVKGKLFGNSCGAENIILGMNKMRFKDGKGDPLGFRIFLEEANLGKGLIQRYRGNRLHILFHLALVYHQHYDKFIEYLQNKCLNNTQLRHCLLEDFNNPFFHSELQALGLVGNLLTKPWLKTFYQSHEESTFSHMEGFQKIQDVLQAMSNFVDATEKDLSRDFFGNQLENHGLWENVDLDIVCRLLQETLVVVRNQYQRYSNMTITDELVRATSSARLHNIDSEEVMGMFSAAKARAPNATIMLISAKIRARKNKTIAYIDELANHEDVFNFVRVFARKLKVKDKNSVASLKKELATRICQKMQLREKSSRRKIEKDCKTLLNAPLKKLREKFPSLEDSDIRTLHEILCGKIVGGYILHNWAVGRDLVIETYNGRVEKVKRLKKDMKYHVCYWGTEESYNEHGEDFIVPVAEIATDFICKDLFVI